MAWVQLDIRKPIDSEDFSRLQDYFSRYMEPNPLILLRLVMFNVMYYLCRRGRENFAEMTKDTFSVSNTSFKSSRNFFANPFIDCPVNKHFD